jgi:endonuclease YncB( thermonuclease family)
VREPTGRSHRLSGRTLLKLVAASLSVLIGSACALQEEQAPRENRATAATESQAPANAGPAAPGVVTAAPAVPQAGGSGASSAPPAPATAAVLLRAATGGDGDSWRDTEGNEYRLGLVNAPETNECYGPEATASRKALTSSGFSAQVYARDTYGRDVSVVTTAGGVNVNVHLARNGFTNDKYLEQFRVENPALGTALDAAFVAAKAERKGLWGACGTTRSRSPAPVASRAAPAPVPPPATSSASCHPDYATCIAVKGDGSGRGDANDLDCGSIGKRVQVRVSGIDPYRLDGDADGMGCD